MLAKKTSKNQVTLPKKALEDIPETDYPRNSFQPGNPADCNPRYRLPSLMNTFEYSRTRNSASHPQISAV